MCAELVEARPSTGAVLSLSKGSGRIDRQPGSPGKLLIFDVLQHRTKRPVHSLRIHRDHAEQLEGGDPVDRLSDARPLLQVQPTEPLDHACCLLREQSRAARHSAPYDLSRTGWRRVVDPVEEAAALERVMKFPSP